MIPLKKLENERYKDIAKIYYTWYNINRFNNFFLPKEGTMKKSFFAIIVSAIVVLATAGCSSLHMKDHAINPLLFEVGKATTVKEK
jgi:hypothetical protein